MMCCMYSFSAESSRRFCLTSSKVAVAVRGAETCSDEKMYLSLPPVTGAGFSTSTPFKSCLSCDSEFAFQ